jgi:large subunit ribosomal protein L24
MAKQAGIVEREASIHVSKVMLVCNKCSHPVRVGSSLIEGKKVRTCAACHEVID